jgi:hypothetical protein
VEEPGDGEVAEVTQTAKSEIPLLVSLQMFIFATSKRVRRIFLYGVAAILASLLLAAVFTFCGSVECVLKTRMTTELDELTPIVWPEFSSPTSPRISVIRGSGPRDLGSFGKCCVLAFDDGGDDIDSYVLVFSTPKHLGQFTGSFKCSSNDDDFTVHLEGQSIIFVSIMPAMTHSAKGTLFYLAGMDVFSEHELKLLNEARRLGWHVVASTVDISFIEPQTLHADLRGIIQLATRIDSHLAARAYAVETMMAFLTEKYPELMKGPRILVGTSAGAIAAPTVAAKVGNFDAAVLIGGGENIARVVLTSPLFVQHTTLFKGPTSSKDNAGGEQVADYETRLAFASKVLAASRLDPAKTSGALKRLPVLLVHARYDKIVPANAGDDLRKSLNFPERWTYNTGHIGLMIMMQWKFKQVLAWIDQQVNKPSRAE